MVDRRCDGPACRLRAGDLGLAAATARPSPASGAARRPSLRGATGARWCVSTRRDRAVAAAAVAAAAGGCRCSCATPDSPISRLEAAARRRGAYAAATKLTATAARELVAHVRAAGVGRGPGAFAARVLCERDPHLVREGQRCVAERAGAARRRGRCGAASSRARAIGVEWLEPRTTHASSVRRLRRRAAPRRSTSSPTAPASPTRWPPPAASSTACASRPPRAASLADGAATSDAARAGAGGARRLSRAAARRRSSARLRADMHSFFRRLLALAAAGRAVRPARRHQAAPLPRDAARPVAQPRPLALRAAHPAPRRLRRLLARPARPARRRHPRRAPVPDAPRPARAQHHARRFPTRRSATFARCAR